MKSSLGFFFFFQAEDGIRDLYVTGVQTCALPICMLDALDLARDRARGVAMVEEDVSDTELAELGARGVHGLRLDLFKRAELRTGEVFEYIVRSGRQAQKLGWHLQFYVPGGVVRDLVPYLGDLDVDFVIDHMGYMLESDGLTRSDFDRLLDVMQRGCGWLKLSGFYRVAKDGNFAKLKPLAKATVDALPGRTIWGSDWPHIPDGGRDSGELLNLLGRRAALATADPTEASDFGRPCRGTVLARWDPVSCRCATGPRHLGRRGRHERWQQRHRCARLPMDGRTVRRGPADPPARRGGCGVFHHWRAGISGDSQPAPWYGSVRAECAF